MEMLDKRLNDKGKNWRHVFKSLTVLDYLLHAGSENVVVYFRDNIYVIKTLKEFQYFDEYGKDQGANVRQKAKDITNLLTDEARLRQERRSRAHMRDRMLGQEGAEEEDDENNQRREGPATSPAPRRPGAGGGANDEELRRAIEASKRSLAEEQARGAEERELEQAIKLSEEEEARRAKALLDANNQALFDDQHQLCVTFYVFRDYVFNQDVTQKREQQPPWRFATVWVCWAPAPVHDPTPVYVLQPVRSAGTAGGSSGTC
jgi:epsin